MTIWILPLQTTDKGRCLVVFYNAFCVFKYLGSAILGRLSYMEWVWALKNTLLLGYSTLITSAVSCVQTLNVDMNFLICYNITLKHFVDSSFSIAALVCTSNFLLFLLTCSFLKTAASFWINKMLEEVFFEVVKHRLRFVLHLTRVKPVYFEFQLGEQTKFVVDQVRPLDCYRTTLLFLLRKFHEEGNVTCRIVMQPPLFLSTFESTPS